MAGVGEGVAVAVVVEVGPDLFGAAGADSVGPDLEFGFGVVVAVPLFGAVEAEVEVVGGFDEFIREAGTAGGAEDDAGGAEGIVDGLVPPAFVAKLDDIAAGRIELTHDALQASSGVVKAGRELEEEAAHARAKEIRDVAEIFDECFGSAEPLDVGDQLTDFDGVEKVFALDLAEPCLDGGNGGPGVERGIEFDGFEAGGVVIEPLICGERFGVEIATPVPVEPAGAADVVRFGWRSFRRVDLRGRHASGVHFGGAEDVCFALFGASSFTPLAALGGG